MVKNSGLQTCDEFSWDHGWRNLAPKMHPVSSPTLRISISKQCNCIVRSNQERMDESRDEPVRMPLFWQVGSCEQSFISVFSLGTYLLFRPNIFFLLQHHYIAHVNTSLYIHTSHIVALYCINFHPAFHRSIINTPSHSPTMHFSSLIAVGLIAVVGTISAKLQGKLALRQSQQGVFVFHKDGCDMVCASPDQTHVSCQVECGPEHQGGLFGNSPCLLFNHQITL